MFLDEILDLLGLPAEGWGDELPENPVAALEAKAARWAGRIQKIQAALIRRRRVIEGLKQRGGRELRLRRHEANYGLLLERLAQARKRLQSLRGQVRAAKLSQDAGRVR